MSLRLGSRYSLFPIKGSIKREVLSQQLHIRVAHRDDRHGRPRCATKTGLAETSLPTLQGRMTSEVVRAFDASATMPVILRRCAAERRVGQRTKPGRVARAASAQAHHGDGELVLIRFPKRSRREAEAVGQLRSGSAHPIGLYITAMRTGSKRLKKLPTEVRLRRASQCGMREAAERHFRSDDTATIALR